MIKKLFKFWKPETLWFIKEFIFVFILWLWCINFSYWLWINDYNQDNAIFWTIDNNNIQYIQTYSAYWPAYVWIDNWINFYSKFWLDEFDKIWVIWSYAWNRWILMRIDNNLYTFSYYYPWNFRPSAYKFTKVSLCDWTYNNCTKIGFDAFLWYADDWLYFTDYYMNYLGVDSAEVLFICLKFGDWSNSICLNSFWRNYNSSMIFSDFEWDRNFDTSLLWPSNIENILWFTLIADESPFPVHSSGGGWLWQRFPINWNRPWIKWSSMVREYTNDEILSAFVLYWFDKNYSCYAWIPINWDYSWYVLWSGASIFDIVSNFYDLWYTSVSQFSDYDLEVAAKWLDYYASSVQSSVFYYSWWYDIFYWFKNGVLSNQSHWMQSLFYYWTYFWQFSSREAIDIINFCRLSLDNTLSWTWIYSWTLPDIPILNQISFDDNWNAIWFAWDFWTWESMLSALSWENIDYDFIWFASYLKDKFQTIFIWNAYHTTWIIPEYILWFLMLFLLFKFLRK